METLSSVLIILISYKLLEIERIAFVAQYRREAGRTGIFA